MKKKIEDIKSNLSDVLELPKDIVMDLPKITMIGSLQIYVENHKGIIEYNNENIRINSNSGIIKITGEKMYIKTIVTEEIIIVGDIKKIEFLK